MTYNVRRCVGADGVVEPRRIAEVITHCAPDIVALQELDVGHRRTGGVDQAQAIAKQLTMNFHFHPAVAMEQELYGDAILTSLPMHLVKADALPGPSMFEPRGALWATVETRDGPVQIINTHLGLAARERMVQIEALLGQNWLDHEDCRGPVILLGDLNAVRRSRVYRKLSDRLQDAQAQRRGRPLRTFPARVPLLRIDHIFCNASVEVLAVETARTALARLASDHLPLVMDFRLQPAAHRHEGRAAVAMDAMHLCG